MKLLICTQTMDKNDPILGFFHRWVEEFAKHFERIDVICIREGAHTLPSHVFVHSLGKDQGKGKITHLWLFYRYLWQFYKNSNGDIVFFHMGDIFNVLAAPYFFIRKFKHLRFVWWKGHGHINWKGHVALVFVDEVVSSTPSSFAVKTKKKRFIGVAVDTNLFNYDSTKPINYNILFAGRVSRVKRVEQIILIVKELRKRGKEVAARIVGSQVDKKFFEELQSLVKKENLSELITFIEGVNQEELVKEYQQAAILINPSDTDSPDKVVLEAMACGSVPLTGSIAFEESLGPYNLFMKKGDIKGYADAIEHIFDMDSEERNILRKSLRNIILSEHAMATLPKRIFRV